MSLTCKQCGGFEKNVDINGGHMINEIIQPYVSLNQFWECSHKHSRYTFKWVIRDAEMNSGIPNILLNIQDKNINFTMEIEKSDYLPFLDLRIIKNNKLEFGIFRKDTHSDN